SWRRSTRNSSSSSLCRPCSTASKPASAMRRSARAQRHPRPRNSPRRRPERFEEEPHMQTRETTIDQQAFERAMRDFQQRIDGHVGVMVRDLDSGLELTWNHEDVFPTASTMKVQLLYALYRLAQDGEIDLSTR